MSLAYYNEHDSYAAEWLRNLIAAGHIAPGVVDSRDIRDIVPDELKGFTQCHFFAGVGVWSYALRQAGIPDDQPLWTGSCPCQPFSAAGGRKGIADERHLWPHWFWLISQCRPSLVLGEQVASKDGLGWLDLVSADLEGAGYAVGAVDTCAAGVSVDWQDSQAGEWLQRAIHDCTDPRIAMQLSDFADWAGTGNIGDGGKHIRQRLYFVGLADGDEQQRNGRRDAGSSRRREFADGGTTSRMEYDPCDGRVERRTEPSGRGVTGGCGVERLDDDDDARPQGHAWDDRAARREGSNGPIAAPGVSDGLANNVSQQRPFGTSGSDDARGRDEKPTAPSGFHGDSGLADTGRGGIRDERFELGSAPSGMQGASWEQRVRSDGRDGGSTSERSDPGNRRRDAVDWLFCRDDKWRSVESGTFPLAHGVTARVGKLRAFGNALDAKTATSFCEVVKEICDD